MRLTGVIGAVFLLTYVGGQWMSGCGISMYPDAGELQAWTKDKMSANVIAGVDGRPNEFPWLVMIEYMGTPLCGGTILNENYVLTTATCVRSLQVSELRVITSRHDRTTGGSFYTVGDITQHSSYNNVTREWDIALLRTDFPIAMHQNTTGVCAPEVADHTGYQLTVSGWGQHLVSGDFPNTMQYANLYGLSGADCNNTFPSQIDNMMCADHPTYFRGACDGDLGGPLVFNNGGQFQLVGLVAWAENCENGNPGRFTEVFNYLSWIANNAT